VTVTVEELLGELLPRFCEACGEGLPAPGEQCGTCGTLPQVTRAEAEQRLAQPGAVAAVRAAQLRQEVQRERERLRGLLRQADLTEHVARLEAARGEVAARLPAARELAARAKHESKRAHGREREAARRAEDSRVNFKRCADAEEAARRTGAGAAIRTEALMRMNAAAPVLEADQAAHRGATSERERAEQALTAARAHASALEEELAAAQRAVDEPGRAPKSVVTLALDLVHQAQLEDLTEAERAWVRAYGAAVAALSGAGEDIAARAVELHKGAQEEAARSRPMLTTPAGPGQVAAWPNPHHAATPQPYHPPARRP
jgi:hypothetical protein